MAKEYISFDASYSAQHTYSPANVSARGLHAVCHYGGSRARHVWVAVFVRVVVPICFHNLFVLPDLVWSWYCYMWLTP